MTVLASRTCSFTSALLLCLAPVSLLAQSAELFLQSLDAPNGPFEQGDSFTIESRTTNLGDANSGPYTITFYASDDFGVSEDDVPIASQDRDGLPAATEDSTPVVATIPINLTPGQYYVNGFIDFDDEFPQNNENFDASPFEVVQSSGSAFVINSGLNDAWFNAATNGQGFFITIFPDIGAIFVAWFTYDTERPPANVIALLGEPGHRWLTAFGDYEGNIASLAIELTEGGVFNSAEPMVDQSAYGTIEIEFIDCNNAILTYDIPSLGLMGVIPLTRIAADNVPRCQEAQAQ